jgi:aminopeptidase-like protein
VTSVLTEPARREHVGLDAYELMRRLYPLCRSLTGDGVRATFDVLEEQIPLTRTEIPSGSRVCDWIVPEEWNLREAHITAPDGSRVVDSNDSTLHVVSYSEPVRARLSLEQLRGRLHTLPEQPDVIPYRTSYYERTWGFCLPHRQLLELPPGEYEVVIDSTLEPGRLTYAEHLIPGRGPKEVLVSTYVCHPSLANDNLSGIAVATMLARRLQGRPLRHSYRFLFAPGTIGPLAWLERNHETLDAVAHGLTVSCIGDEGDLTYKRSRHGDAEVDLAMETVLRDSGEPHRVLPWEPWGGDERQFCSPGFDLPVGTLMRTPHGEFDGYHTSADALELIRPESLAAAVDRCLELVEVLESNRTCANLSPFGEPQLGRRGLYRRSELRYPLVSRAAELLEDAELLEAGPPEPDSAPVP